MGYPSGLITCGNVGRGFMDGTRFDAISKLFGASTSRRTGIRVAAMLAAAATRAIPGIATATATAGATASPRAHHIGPAGPCGPTGPDNKCKKDKDCCTGYCRLSKSGDKAGRCRCIKINRKCKKGQTCCGSATCQNKVCTLPAPACTPIVCPSGCPFTTVEDAYAASAAGSTIVIAPGTYTTGVIVTK
ncbi:MAG: hypothetical protein ACR2J8_07370, partial [Thermomicrobiales bacterium]